MDGSSIFLFYSTPKGLFGSPFNKSFFLLYHSNGALITDGVTLKEAGDIKVPPMIKVGRR